MILINIKFLIIFYVIIELKLCIYDYVFIIQGTTDPMETRFLLSDQVYAKARIPPTENVNLWLGVSMLK